MERIKARPWSAAALVGSVAWIVLCSYEVWFRQKGVFADGPGEFLKLQSVVETSSVGVIGLAALAWLIERIWPPPQRY